MLFRSGSGSSVDNSGIIAGRTSGIQSTVATMIVNSGTIGSGTVSGGVFTPGGNGFGIQVGSGTIVNSGTVNGAGAAIYSTGALNLTNTGTLVSRSTGRSILPTRARSG